MADKQPHSEKGAQGKSKEAQEPEKAKVPDSIKGRRLKKKTGRLFLADQTLERTAEPDSGSQGLPWTVGG